MREDAEAKEQKRRDQLEAYKARKKRRMAQFE
jgi:hypothetical protein